MVDFPGVLGSSVTRPNFQYALLNATVTFQDVLGNKQGTDSEAGIVATDLLSVEYELSVEVLEEDTAAVQEASGSDAFNLANQVYQNDSAVCQTGQNNANTAVQQSQTQVSQSGTNLSNLVSLATTLIQIGQYVAGLIGQAYA